MAFGSCRMHLHGSTASRHLPGRGTGPGGWGERTAEGTQLPGQGGLRGPERLPFPEMPTNGRIAADAWALVKEKRRSRCPRRRTDNCARLCRRESEGLEA